MHRRRAAVIAAIACLVGLALPASAQQQHSSDILRSLHFQSGTVTLGDKLAEIVLTDKFRYIDNADTQTFLVKVWGNPPGAGSHSLGTILPTDVNPTSDAGYAVIIFYNAAGYVSDEDAGNIDYDALMHEMQEDTAEESKERVKNGLSSVELVGWARKPYYDAAAKKLYWARRLRFGDSSEDTLNYEIRILGRRGYLDLNVVASMSALAGIDQRANAILSMVHFNQGNTYAEYDPKIDKSAAYGLAGLIAGGILVKTGFFKGLLLLLLASKKFLAIGVIGVLAAFRTRLRRLFGRKPVAAGLAVQDDAPPPSDDKPPTS